MGHSVLDQNVVIAVIGLGYVGLPVAVEFGKNRSVIGFDVNKERIKELTAGNDKTLEVDHGDLALAQHIVFSSDPADLTRADVFIIAVPTPIDAHKRPDLGPLLSASRTVGQRMKPGALVIYESTVYPGATEEDCVPILEFESGLRFNVDFFCGYSPERINPGDKVHRLTMVRKVTSGSTPLAAEAVDQLYGSIIEAGTYPAESIRVAEAAKVIENTQRDLNIALMNEFAIIFNRMGIDTNAVLEAAGSKWNFLPFRPGLVGGHCIGVDPYYLTHKAEEIGYHPQIVLAGRRLNDSMGLYVAERMIKALIKKGFLVKGSRILVMGLTFKENCPDLRNTRVIDLINELISFGCCVDVTDPWASSEDAYAEYGVDLLAEVMPGTYDGIILAVAHREFCVDGGSETRRFGKPDAIIYDLKSVLDRINSDMRL